MNQLRKNQLTNQEQDKIDSVVKQIREKNLKSKSRQELQMTPQEWEQEIINAKRGKPALNNFQKINIIIDELEKERAKPPAIQVREKEVVKLEPKCAKCKEKEYTAKLGQLRFITYGALAYSIIITILNIIKNELFKSDFKTFLESVWGIVSLIIKNANMSFQTLSNKVDNEMIQKIIPICLWVVLAGAVIFGIYKLYNEMQYKTWKFWNIGAVGMLLLDLILIVYLSEPIKNLTKINLFIFALLVYIVYIIARVIVYLIKKGEV